MIVGQGHDKNVCAWMHLEEGQNRVWTDSGSVFLQGDSSAPSSLMALNGGMAGKEHLWLDSCCFCTCPASTALLISSFSFLPPIEMLQC